MDSDSARALLGIEPPFLSLVRTPNGEPRVRAAACEWSQAKASGMKAELPLSLAEVESAKRRAQMGKNGSSESEMQVSRGRGRHYSGKCH